jgi:Protein of unknown function (DUF2514)
MNPYLIIAALVGVLAAGAGGFKLGGLSVQADFDRYVSEQQTAHIAELEDARAKEQALQLTNTKVANDYQALKRTSANAATVAQSERVRLLTTIDSIRAASTNTTPSDRADASPTERILAESLGRYEAVAQDADRLSDQVIGLQDYVRGVCAR